MNAPVSTPTEALVRINPTRLRRFTRCEYEWYVRDVLGVDPVRGVPAPHRDRGKLFHALLEHALRCYAATGVPFVYEGEHGKAVAGAVFARAYQAEGTACDEETAYELLDAIRFQLVRLDLASWEVVTLADGTPLIEVDLRARLSDDVELQAKIDVVLRKRATGKVWDIDFKTSLYPLNIIDIAPFIEFDDQLNIGRTVLAANGIHVDYVALLHLRSRAPETPPLVYVGKPGERTTLSVANLSCDWETYATTLVERGENPESAEALKVREALKAQQFSRWQVDITDAVGREALRVNMLYAAERMAAIVRGTVKPVRRLAMGHYRSNTCAKCDYGTWCRASMREGGSPPVAVLGIHYEARSTSSLAVLKNPDTAVFDPVHAYVEWAAQQGRDVEAIEEFKP